MSRVPRPRREDGAAAVEVALLAPLLALLLLGSMHLHELSFARIKQQEVVRYVAWEHTARQLSDLAGGDHGRRFEEVRRDVLREAAQRYRDLQGHDRAARDFTGVATRIRLGPLAAERRRLDAAGGIRGGGGVVARVLAAMGRSLDAVLGGAFGLDVDGAAVDASASMSVESLLLPAPGALLATPLLPERFRRMELQPARLRLGADTFHADDGSDVHLPGGEGERGHPFWKQVQRMHLFARARRRLLGPADAAVRAVERLLPVRGLTEAQVVAQRYVEPGQDVSPMHCRSRRPEVVAGAWRNGDGFGHGGPTAPDGISPEKCFDTLPLQSWGTARGYARDPSFRTLHARRDRFLGCPAGREEGDCR